MYYMLKLSCILQYELQLYSISFCFFHKTSTFLNILFKCNFNKCLRSFFFPQSRSSSVKTDCLICSSMDLQEQERPLLYQHVLNSCTKIKSSTPWFQRYCRYFYYIFVFQMHMFGEIFPMKKKTYRHPFHVVEKGLLLVLSDDL